MLEKLGIKKINWEFKFHPHGKSFQDTPLTIYADIGNQISGGVSITIPQITNPVLM